VKNGGSKRCLYLDVRSSALPLWAVFGAEFFELCPHRHKPALEDTDDLTADLGRRKGDSVYKPTPTVGRRHRKAVGIERVLRQPHQRGMLIVGEVKIRHSGDMGSRSRRAALYHGFPEQTVARVTVTTLLQRGYSGQRNVRECTGET
jgi:hypothetical protein